MIRKESSLEFFKILAKGFKEGLVGGKNLAVDGEKFLEKRKEAQKIFPEINKIFKPTRARIKSEESILGSIKKKPGFEENPYDLLGIQVMGKGEKKISKTIDKFKENDLPVHAAKVFTRPGYHGVNIQTTYKNIPMEVQLTPGRLANTGQIVQHYAYKPTAKMTQWDIDKSDRVGKFLIKHFGWKPEQVKKMEEAFNVKK